MNLTSPVLALPGIGNAYARKLTKLGISTVFDLLLHLPFRYDDRTRTSPIATVQAGEQVSVTGTITAITTVRTRSGRFIQQATLADSTGLIQVLWFNQPFLVSALRLKTIALSGKVDFYKGRPAFISPEYELVLPNRPLLHTSRLVPVYPETAGISSKWLRAKIFSLLPSLPAEIMPEAYNHLSWSAALSTVHFPASLTDIPAARTRLAFDELFLLQLQSQLMRQQWHHLTLAHALVVDSALIADFIARLPFNLTSSQSQAIQAILSDLSAPTAMNRLLEGDVGTGKTVVAAIAAYVAHLNGFQSVFLAPTQILAAQHYQTLVSLFQPFGLSIAQVTGSSRPKPASHAPQPDILVGTHALLSEKNRYLFHRVGFVVIDEQHRFGVLQRALASQLGTAPHVLTMTATPIPRSIALTMFGDLDLSVLTDKPTGRLPVKTWLVPETKRASAYTWVSDQLTATASQAFVVCPFIDDSETLATVKAATTEFHKLVTLFPRHRLGLLHGKMPAADKSRVITAFRAGDYAILVCTPIVEVGIDIPNAAIMLIEGAERFGLAQLHQLRGRVGRSDQQSYCLLFTTQSTPSPRLKVLETTNSGIQLAEADLKFRGPGEIYGSAQHGFPQFKIASFDALDLLDRAKTAAAAALSNLDHYPVLRDLVKTDKITHVKPN